jgi:hypothetical protein
VSVSVNCLDFSSEMENRDGCGCLLTQVVVVEVKFSGVEKMEIGQD